MNISEKNSYGTSVLIKDSSTDPSNNVHQEFIFECPLYEFATLQVAVKWLMMLQRYSMRRYDDVLIQACFSRKWLD